jgi:hypothetical protein
MSILVLYRVHRRPILICLATAQMTYFVSEMHSDGQQSKGTYRFKGDSTTFVKWSIQPMQPSLLRLKSDNFTPYTAVHTNPCGATYVKRMLRQCLQKTLQIRILLTDLL